jgi:hypothetical protein
MSLNKFININEAHPWMNINCNALKVNGSLITATVPVKQMVPIYIVSFGNTLVDFTNLYYTSDDNSVTMRGRFSYDYFALQPQTAFSVIFFMPPEFQANFQTNVTPVFSGYLCQKNIINPTNCNGLISSVDLLGGGGQVSLNFTPNLIQNTPTSFTVVFEVSLIKNL